MRVNNVCSDLLKLEKKEYFDNFNDSKKVQDDLRVSGEDSRLAELPCMMVQYFTGEWTFTGVGCATEKSTRVLLAKLAIVIQVCEKRNHRGRPLGRCPGLRARP